MSEAMRARTVQRQMEMERSSWQSRTKLAFKGAPEAKPAPAPLRRRQIGDGPGKLA